MANARAGETGLTLMEYIGGNVGKASWWGPVTGTRYEFGLSKAVGYVDNRDVADMLNVVQGRRPVFKKYVQPVVKIVETVQYAPGEGPLAVASLVAQDVAEHKAKVEDTADMIAAVVGAVEVLDSMAEEMPDAVVVTKSAEMVKQKRTRKAKHV